MKTRSEPFPEIIPLLQADLFLNLVVALFLLVGQASRSTAHAAAARPGGAMSAKPLRLYLAPGSAVRVGTPQAPALALTHLAGALTNLPAECLLHHAPELPAGDVFAALLAVQTAAPQLKVRLTLN